MFEIIDQAPQDGAVIKVIGVGGCGGNAVEHMIAKGLTGVEFVCANTDAQALKRSTARTQIQLGGTLTRGLGAGAKPEIGRDAAMEDRDRIAETIEGADMLFITAGIEELTKRVDSLIVIPNEKLMQVLGEDTSMLDAFAAANDVLHGAVSGIAEVINNPGLVNVDFADVRTVMGEVGMAMMGSATANGADRSRQAAQAAVRSPLLEEVNLAGARGVLVNITASSGFKMKEYHDVMNTIKEFTAEDAMVIVGTVIDDAMDDQLRVTMIATGLSGPITTVKRTPKIEVVPATTLRTGTDDAVAPRGEIDYDKFDQPAVTRTGRARIASPGLGSFDPAEFPAFLRKQAD